MDYEQKMKQLENIVNQLESGDVNFDDATKLFEEGAILSKELSNMFETTKGKVIVIREELMGLIKEEDMN